MAGDLRDIVSQLRRELPRLLMDRPVLVAYLHGSLARGQATPQSDVDV